MRFRVGTAQRCGECKYPLHPVTPTNLVQPAMRSQGHPVFKRQNRFTRRGDQHAIAGQIFPPAVKRRASHPAHQPAHRTAAIDKQVGGYCSSIVVKNNCNDIAPFAILHISGQFWCILNAKLHRLCNQQIAIGRDIPSERVINSGER